MDKNKHVEIYEYESFDVIDMKVFELIKNQSEGDSSIVREIYLSYFSEAEVLMKLINEHANKNNYEKLRVSVHSLSGISATVGAKKMKEITKDIEIELRNENFNEASVLVPMLNRAFQELKKTINQLI